MIKRHQFAKAISIPCPAFSIFCELYLFYSIHISRGLTIVPWLTGDYLIQCKLLGLQGASGMQTKKYKFADACFAIINCLIIIHVNKELLHCKESFYNRSNVKILNWDILNLYQRSSSLILAACQVDFTASMSEQDLWKSAKYLKCVFLHWICFDFTILMNLYQTSFCIV